MSHMSTSADPHSISRRPAAKTPVSLRITRRVVTLVAILILYVLSYAPVVRMTATPQHLAVHYGTHCEITTTTTYHTRQWYYAPVRWLTKSTPLREPLLVWADVWGMWEVLE